VRSAYFALFSDALLQAQDGEVGWDPKPISMWQILAGLALIAVVIYGLWRLARWILKR